MKGHLIDGKRALELSSSDKELLISVYNDFWDLVLWRINKNKHEMQYINDSLSYNLYKYDLISVVRVSSDLSVAIKEADQESTIIINSKSISDQYPGFVIVSVESNTFRAGEQWAHLIKIMFCWRNKEFNSIEG